MRWSACREANIVERGKQAEIFAGAQARIKTAIRCAVVAELLPHAEGFAHNIGAAHPGAPAGRQQKRGQNAQEGRFARAIGAHERDDFAGCDSQRRRRAEQAPSRASADAAGLASRQARAGRISPVARRAALP